MAVRASCEGHLCLSLVTCPVVLYPATSEADTVHFNLINPATGNRIKMQTSMLARGEEVSRGDLVMATPLPRTGMPSSIRTILKR